MSTPVATDFGHEFGEEYAEVLAKWAKKLKGVDKITDEMRKEWSSDLQKSLGKRTSEFLLKEVAPKWKKIGALPPKDTLDRYTKLSIKRSFFTDTEDLLERLRVRAQLPDEELDEVTAAILPVSHLIKRAGQTVAQIFDMVRDRFNRTIAEHYENENKLTGRRRWRTASLNSRHKDLNLSIKNKDEDFVFNGNSISGPRPVGGSPEHWSNCSCFVQYERASGEWVTI